MAQGLDTRALGTLSAGHLATDFASGAVPALLPFVVAEFDLSYVAAGAVKKAAAPDAVDRNTASAEQMTRLGLDEATQQKVVAGRPYSGLDDAKLKEAIPASTLSKLDGKVTVKPKAK